MGFSSFLSFFFRASLGLGGGFAEDADGFSEDLADLVDLVDKVDVAGAAGAAGAADAAGATGSRGTDGADAAAEHEDPR